MGSEMCIRDSFREEVTLKVRRVINQWEMTPLGTLVVEVMPVRVKDLRHWRMRRIRDDMVRLRDWILDSNYWFKYHLWFTPVLVADARCGSMLYEEEPPRSWVEDCRKAGRDTRGWPPPVLEVKTPGCLESWMPPPDHSEFHWEVTFPAQ